MISFNFYHAASTVRSIIVGNFKRVHLQCESVGAVGWGVVGGQRWRSLCREVDGYISFGFEPQI